MVMVSGKYEGYCIDLMQEIEKELNFTAIYYEATAFGQLNENDMSWTGAVGELVNKK